MRALLPLLSKDVKDLIRDPRIFIPFIISALIMPVIGVVIGASYQATIKEILAKPITSVSIVPLDNGSYTKKLIEYLSASKYVRLYIFSSINEALTKSPSNSIIVVPPNFSKQLEMYIHGEAPPPSIVIVQKVYSMAMGLKGLRASMAASIVIDALRNILMKQFNVSRPLLQALMNPLYSVPLIYVVNREAFIPAWSQALNSLSLPLIIVPIIVAMIGATVLQIAATSMALENEVKTLETLLTFPIPRVSILTSKILSSFCVGIAGSVLNVIGFWLYMVILTQSFGSISRVLGAVGATTQLLRSVGIERVISPIQLIMPTPSLGAVVLASAIISILFLAVLGVLIGSLCSDVRIASTFMAPIMLPLMIGVYFIGFIDPTQLPKAVLTTLISIPLVQTAILAKLAMVGVWVESIPLGIALSIALTIALLVLTAKMLNMDRLASIQYKLKEKRFGFRFKKAKSHD